MRDGSAEEIVKALCRRLEKGNWTVWRSWALNDKFRWYLKPWWSSIAALRMVTQALWKALSPVLALSFLWEVSANLHHPVCLSLSVVWLLDHIFTVFVKKYAKYLEEKISVLRLLGFQFENQKDVCNGIKPPRAFKVIPKLQSQLNALLNCKVGLKLLHLILRCVLNTPTLIPWSQEPIFCSWPIVCLCTPPWIMESAVCLVER